MLPKNNDFFESLANDVQCYLTDIHSATSEREKDLVALSINLTNAFKEYFFQEGLDGIDNLIDSINAILTARNAKNGLASGAVCEGPEGKEPELLHICFVEYNTEAIVAHQTIKLR